MVSSEATIRLVEFEPPEDVGQLGQQRRAREEFDPHLAARLQP